VGFIAKIPAIVVVAPVGKFLEAALASGWRGAIGQR
jgi:hypothetical protein